MTYAKKETLLRLDLDIYECKGEVNKCKGEVNEVFKQYLYQRKTSEKIPARVPIKSTAVGSASHRRTWSHINLMKACLGCRSIRSVRWAVKKVHAQTEIMYDKSGVIVVI